VERGISSWAAQRAVTIVDGFREGIVMVKLGSPARAGGTRARQNEESGCSQKPGSPEADDHSCEVNSRLAEIETAAKVGRRGLVGVGAPGKKVGPPPCTPRAIR